MIGPVGIPQASDQWILSFGHKKAMYGPLRAAVGGACEEKDKDTAKRKRADDDFEPSSYHGMVSLIPSEMLHTFPHKGVIDFTASTPELALECILNEVPYLAVCYTEEHAEMLRPRAAAA